MQPAITDASINPPMPNFVETGTRSTTNAAVGPVTLWRAPPRSAAPSKAVTRDVLEAPTLPSWPRSLRPTHRKAPPWTTHVLPSPTDTVEEL